jgi:hypothetical protein
MELEATVARKEVMVVRREATAVKREEEVREIANAIIAAILAI